ncbi:hypothetical protein GCM10022393_30090 [Aquimarina addita]|uniref:DUF3347 domain-containing protein n=1 Tax=Aquimarina addita TaxID=870485 RepID=A0ABP6UPN0_9FLAO
MKKIIVLLAIFFTIPSFGQDSKKINLIDYIKEIQVWEKENSTMSMSFWIPGSYWKIAMQDNPQVPEEIIYQLTAALKEYVFICTLNAKINIDGTMQFEDEAVMRSTLSIEDSTGKTYLPLENDLISADALSLSEAIKPLFSQMFGQMGAGMHFYFFKIQDKKGTNLIDEYKDGSFTIYHSDRKFNYNLPLITLLPIKKCPTDEADMQGNWKYCPIHGVVLKDQ